MPYATVVDVMLILTRGPEVLLACRANTGYADGLWNLPSGKLEDGEDALSAVVREADEEIGIRLDPGDLTLAATVHCRNPEGQGRLGLFFAAVADPPRQGEPRNAEPHKCAEIGWFPLDRLPANTVPYIASGIHLYRRGRRYAALGWDTPA